MDKKKILVVSPFFPYPALFGGTFDIWERIKGLKKIGYSIDLLYTDKQINQNIKNVNHVKLYIDDIYSVKRRNKIAQLFSTKPLQVISRKGLEKVHLEKKYYAIILESENVGSVLNNKHLTTNYKFIRVHNNESVYFKGLAKSSSNIFSKLYFYQESIKYKKYSSNVFSKADRLWFISTKEEANYRKKNYNLDNSIHLPAPINATFVNRKLDNQYILFIGSLFMNNNLEGIIWYLNNIHNIICKSFPDYKLIICGSTGRYTEEHFTKKFEKYNNVKLFFNLLDLEEVYNSASIFINPMLNGAGVKLKSINAIVNGLPIITTKIGAEGIGLLEEKMYYLANSEEDYIEAIKKIFNSDINKTKVMVQNAQQFLKNRNYINILERELKC